MANIVDTVLTYQFIKRFVRPFDKWPAFKAGVIDKDGNVLIKRNKLTSQQDLAFGNYDRLILNLRKLLAKIPGGRTTLGLWAATALLLKEKDSLDPDDIETLQEKLEETIDHLQLDEGVKYRFAAHEPQEGEGIPHKIDAWHESRKNGWCVQTMDKHGNQIGYAEYIYHKKDAMNRKKELISHHKLHEDAGAGAVPANAVGGGHIAGTQPAGDDPPVGKNAWNKYKRKNKKFSEMPFARRAGAKNG